MRCSETRLKKSSKRAGVVVSNQIRNTHAPDHPTFSLQAKHLDQARSSLLRVSDIWLSTPSITAFTFCQMPVWSLRSIVSDVARVFNIKDIGIIWGGGPGGGPVSPYRPVRARKGPYRRARGPGAVQGSLLDNLGRMFVNRLLPPPKKNCIILQAHSEHMDVTKGYNLCACKMNLCYIWTPQRDAKGTKFQPLSIVWVKRAPGINKKCPWKIPALNHIQVVVLQVVIPTLQELVPAST